MVLRGRGAKESFDSALENKPLKESIKSRLSEALPVAKATVASAVKKGGSRILEDLKGQVGSGNSSSARKRKATAIFQPEKSAKRRKKGVNKTKSIFD